jgi:hypothetical protein
MDGWPQAWRTPHSPIIVNIQETFAVTLQE